jgi:hypothetical protein
MITCLSIVFSFPAPGNMVFPFTKQHIFMALQKQSAWRCIFPPTTVHNPLIINKAKFLSCRTTGDSRFHISLFVGAFIGDNLTSKNDNLTTWSMDITSDVKWKLQFIYRYDVFTWWRHTGNPHAPLTHLPPVYRFLHRAASVMVLLMFPWTAYKQGISLYTLRNSNWTEAHSYHALTTREINENYPIRSQNISAS